MPTLQTTKSTAVEAIKPLGVRLDGAGSHGYKDDHNTNRDQANDAMGGMRHKESCSARTVSVRTIRRGNVHFLR
jgi:hypothetical protein